MKTMHRTDHRTGPMSYRTVRWTLPVAAACAGLLAIAMAAGQAQAPKDQPAGGPPAKLVLFDGKTLDGWKKTDFYHAGEVKVEDGRIVLAAGGSMTGITTTRKDLPTTDYELTYEAMRIERRATSSPRRRSPSASRTSRWSTAAGAAT